jgi:hypothetical protein
MMSLSTYFKQMDKELVEKLTPHLRHKTMDKSNFITGNEYLYKGTTDPMTYLGGCASEDVGRFESNSGLYHYEYRNMSTYTQPQYPNPPLPHCKERIAFAKGANIEYEDRSGLYSKWRFTGDPKWYTGTKYRVKLEKTKDDLRIETLESCICDHQAILDDYKKELAELKPTVHY